MPRTQSSRSNAGAPSRPSCSNYQDSLRPRWEAVPYPLRPQPLTSTPVTPTLVTPTPFAFDKPTYSLRTAPQAARHTSDASLPIQPQDHAPRRPHSNRPRRYQNKASREARLEQDDNVDRVSYVHADGAEMITKVRCRWCSRWLAQDGRFGGSLWNFNKHLRTKRCTQNRLRILQAKEVELVDFDREIIEEYHKERDQGKAELRIPEKTLEYAKILLEIHYCERLLH